MSPHLRSRSLTVHRCVMTSASQLRSETRSDKRLTDCAKEISAKRGR